MRIRHLMLAVAIAIPASVIAQTPARPSTPERFDTAGLPAKASSALEQEIFTLLKYHKRGDLRDAARIHLKLAEYYTETGDKARAGDCTKMASEAWEAAEKGLRVSASPPGTPPFDPAGAFRQNFGYTDSELGATHRWEFYDDGSYAHSLTTSEGLAAPPPREVGWYTVSDGQIRLWKSEPALDRTVKFELLGDAGKGGAVMDGIRMRVVR